MKGGNWQVFEKFIANSGAQVFLNTTASIFPYVSVSSQYTTNIFTFPLQVKSVTKLSQNVPFIIQTTTSNNAKLYRAVILAAPYHQSGVKLIGEPSSVASVPPQPYVRLHVTLLSTSAPTPHATYFNLQPSAKAPSTLLTTHDGVRQRGRAEPEFNSLTYHGHVLTKEGEKRRTATDEEEWVVKIFSKERLTDEWLGAMFEGKAGWVLRKEWDAYPVLPPTTEFPPVKLMDGLYYVNAFEPYVLNFSVHCSGRTGR